MIRVCGSLILLLTLQGALAGRWISMAGKFEGDIALTPEQERQLNSSERQAVDAGYRWTDGIVPYKIDTSDDSYYSDAQIAMIHEAIADYSAYTCIEFKEREDEDDYLFIYRGTGCWSYVGSIGGIQELSLKAGCFSKATIIHEFMHALGFYHEQSRYDRDEYVTVNWDNIIDGYDNNFNAYTSSQVDLLDIPYNLQSVMHYDEYDFSTDWGVLKTIEAIDGTSPLGNEEGFTQLDIDKVNTYYECATTTEATTSEATTSEVTTSEATTSEATTSEATTSEATTSAVTTEEACEDLWNATKCTRLLTKGRCTRTMVMSNCAATCGVC